MDEALNQYPDGAIAIKGDSIVEVGTKADILEKYSSAKSIDCGGKILMPGLVNAHTHVPMTLLRGLADDLRLDVWLMGYMMPVEREFVTPDFCRLGTQLACAEFIRGGVTCFADMYYFEDDIAQATSEAGLRGVLGQSVMKYPTPDAASYDDSTTMAREFIKKWLGHPLIVPSIAPHAPYTLTPEIFKAATQVAVEFDVPLHIHIAETSFEVENMRNEQNMPVVPYVKKQGIFEAKVLAAHCVHIDDGEIHTLYNYKAGVSHNPSSNLKLASGFAPVRTMLETGLNVGIGTDGTASNNDLDMFEEMRLASFISKAITQDPTSLPAWQVLSMATRIGAKAIHIGSITGSLEPGKRADLILLETNVVHNTPKFTRDPNSVYAQIIYAAKSTDVTDVMVNGKWLMQAKQLLTLDEAVLMEQANAYAKKIDAFLIQREQSVLSKLIALGGSTESESFEVQLKVQIDDPKKIIAAIDENKLPILYKKHYKQYDTYFSFESPAEGWLRYREDDIVDEAGKTSEVRSRLTLLGETHEEFAGDALLSRSRFLAPATQPFRFYREYFKPASEKQVEKDRLRWSVKFKGEQFFINVDQLSTSGKQYFLEIKSRTWSRIDAQKKALLAVELMELLGASKDKMVEFDYFEM
jgi:5-methylthioadenosine/S-adenosylhomocysteine deaminase